MNERIRELAEQVGATIGEGFDGTKGFVYGITMSPEELEKFAKLIVEECLYLCESTASGQDAEAIQEAIQQHFGVKE